MKEPEHTDRGARLDRRLAKGFEYLGLERAVDVPAGHGDEVGRGPRRARAWRG